MQIPKAVRVPVPRFGLALDKGVVVDEVGEGRLEVGRGRLVVSHPVSDSLAQGSSVQ